MKLLRQILFWLHLSAGVIAGLAITVMSFTGTMLVLEKPVAAWRESQARIVPVPPRAARLPLDEIIHRLHANAETAPAMSVSIPVDPGVALAVTVGRGERYYIDPYSGAIAPAPGARTRAFFQAMENWHRTLSLAGDRRAWGKSINDAGSFLFLFLAASGLYLWWPRGVLAGRFTAVWRPRFALRGRARDWNWHNALGFWCAPIILVLTITALPLSYRWAGDAIYRLAGEIPPAPGPRLDPSPSKVKNNTASETRPALREENSREADRVGRPDVGGAGARPPPLYEPMLEAVERSAPHWDLITLRLGNASGGRARGAAQSGSVRAVEFTVHSTGEWPRTATGTVRFDAASGVYIGRDDFANQSPGGKMRSWARFLHTGEALGWPGQILAMVGCLGGLVLVATGFSLVIRRAFNRWFARRA